LTSGSPLTNREKAARYVTAWEANGHNFSAVARLLGVSESTVRKSVRQELKRRQTEEDLDPGIRDGMLALGFTKPPHSGWVKSAPGEDGRSYSFYALNGADDSEKVDLIEEMAETFSSIPAVSIPRAPASEAGTHDPNMLGFIPLNDLHGGLYAWGAETGYGDWDLNLAVSRLQQWIGNLVDRMPACAKVVLFFNGDTLHRNGNDPFTPGHKNVLDGDSRQFKVVDFVAAAIIAGADMAAAKHLEVELVIKPGNHDLDSYLALVQAAKWRYRDCPQVTVDLSPSEYWVMAWGSVLLFGHHGDKRKPGDVLTKLVSDHRDLYGNAKHVTLWVAHLHDQMIMTHQLGHIERASCLTSPDKYGAAWGDNAQAQAVVYHRELGERERFTVRPTP